MNRMNIELKKKREQRNNIIRMFFYILLMSVSFVAMSTINTAGVFPLLLIPCAVCFAQREDPFSGALFGCVCGLLLDSAQDALIGFNAIIFMWMCTFISLLFHFILRRNILNFLWLDLTAILMQSLLHYLFFYGIWSYDLSGEVFRGIFIPEIICTNIAGAVIYIITEAVTRRFGTVTEHYIEEKSEDIVRE